MFQEFDFLEFGLGKEIGCDVEHLACVDRFTASFVCFKVGLVLAESVARTFCVIDVSVGRLHLLLDLRLDGGHGSTVGLMLITDELAAARVTVIHHVEAELFIPILAVGDAVFLRFFNNRIARDGTQYTGSHLNF